MATWKGFIAATLFLLASCSKQGHWASDHVHSNKKEFRSTKLTYFSRDPTNGLDVEFLNTDEHLNVYLNIHSIPVPPSKTDPKKTPVKIEIAGERLVCDAYRLEGGQRFLLPEEIALRLIEALKSRTPVLIALTGYRTLLKPDDFTAHFEKLQKTPAMENPFRLPL